MTGHVVGLADDALDGLENERIAVLGYAFKGGTDDTRNTLAKNFDSSVVMINN